jgi:hypothetical protein
MVSGNIFHEIIKSRIFQVQLNKCNTGSMGGILFTLFFCNKGSVIFLRNIAIASKPTAVYLPHVENIFACCKNEKSHLQTRGQCAQHVENGHVSRSPAQKPKLASYVV